MYAETGLLFPYYQNFSLEVPPLDEFWDSQKANDSMNFSLEVPPLDEFWDSQKTSDSMASTILEYDLGAEGDLFKAPEPIIEEPNVDLDPMTAAISMISGGEDVISTQALKVADIELMQNEQLLSEIFCEFKKDLLANEATGTQLSEVMQIQIPIATDENSIAEEKVIPQGNLLKSVSSECLSSMEWIHGNPMRPNFLDFPGMDFGAVYGMRRSFSEGDMKTIVIQSPRGQAQSLGNSTSEDRREKLSRYRTKKTKRNFGRKIKYACRKALADSQPRIRGRFAKTDESDISKSNC